MRYRVARRKVKATFMFAGNSGAFPLCANGLTEPGVISLQTDHLFAERFAALAAPCWPGWLHYSDRYRNGCWRPVPFRQLR